jgi:hypothetical protein
MRVKTAHVHPATCNLAHWLTRHGSPTIYRCFALPELLYRWRHQSEIFWMLVVYCASPDTLVSYRQIWTTNVELSILLGENWLDSNRMASCDTDMWYTVKPVVGWGTSLQAGRSRVRLHDGVIQIIHLNGPEVNSDANINEYHEYFLGVKVAGE